MNSVLCFFGFSYDDRCINERLPAGFVTKCNALQLLPSDYFSEIYLLGHLPATSLTREGYRILEGNVHI